MKKIPTLFERKFENGKIVGVTEKVYPGMEFVLEGHSVPTVKFDGSCCAVINGELYRRYDAKRGKKPPAGAIPCCDPDPVTGHWPHWVKCDRNNANDKWIWAAFDSVVDPDGTLPDGTYEAIGLHFQGNPYMATWDYMVPHGVRRIPELSGPLTLDRIRDFLGEYRMEGIVFWADGKPQCKIKRSDFGLPWP